MSEQQQLMDSITSIVDRQLRKQECLDSMEPLGRKLCAMHILLEDREGVSLTGDEARALCPKYARVQDEHANAIIDFVSLSSPRAAKMILG